MTVEELTEQIQTVAAGMRCTCYFADEMEFDPAGPCEKCRLLAVLEEAA